MTLRSVNGVALCSNCGFDPLTDTTRFSRVLWWLVGVTAVVGLTITMFALSPA